MKAETKKARPETVGLGCLSIARITLRLKLVKPRPSKGSKVAKE